MEIRVNLEKGTETTIDSLEIVFVYDSKNRGGYNDDMLHLVKSNFPEIKIYTNEMIKPIKVQNDDVL